MKHLRYALLAVTLLALAACSLPQSSPPPSTAVSTSPRAALASAGSDIEAPHSARQIVVGYRSEEALDRLASQLGARVALRSDRLRAALLVLPERTSASQALRDVRNLRPEGIRFAEPNFVVERPEPVKNVGALSAGDPLQRFKWDHDVMNAADAWSTVVRDGLTPSGAGTVIAIVDTGIDGTHPDLAGRFVWGFNAWFDASDFDDPEITWPITRCGDIDPLSPIHPGMDATAGIDIHGTHVAGIAAASANNGQGVAGVAPAARIMDIKVFCGGSASSFSIALGIEAALFVTSDLQGEVVVPDVINMSLGGKAYSQVFKDAIDMALTGYDIMYDEPIPGLDTNGDGRPNRTVTVVASMGNSAMDERNYPAAYPGVIAVGATSPRGKASFSTTGNHIAITAPGDEILAPWPVWDTEPNGRPYLYYAISGTSMSAPQVAGAVALVKQFHPGLSPYQVRGLLARTANSAAPYDRSRESGAGLLDLGALAADLVKIEAGSVKAPEAGATVAVQVLGAPFDLGTGPMQWEYDDFDVQLVDAAGVVRQAAKTTSMEGLPLGGYGVALFADIEPGSYDVLVGGQDNTYATWSFLPEHRVTGTGTVDADTGSSLFAAATERVEVASELTVTLRWTGGGDLDLAVLESVLTEGMWSTAKTGAATGVFSGDDTGSSVSSASETFTLDVARRFPTPLAEAFLGNQSLPYVISIDASNATVGQTAYLTLTVNGRTKEFGPIPVLPGRGADAHFERLMKYLPYGIEHLVPIY